MTPFLSSCRPRVLASVAALLLLSHIVAGSAGAPPDPRTLSADMAITSLTASPSPNVANGGTITYTVDYINNGPDTPGSTSVGSEVPASTTFVSMRVVSGSGWVALAQPPVGGTGSIVWRKGDPGQGAASGETAQFEVVVTVDPAAPNNRTISITFSAYSIDPETVDDVSGNNLKSVNTTVTSSVPSLNSDLAITDMTASPSPNVAAGSNITYTISFVNNGPDAATSASVKDTVPSNTTFVSTRLVSGTGWALLYAPSAGGTGILAWRKGYPNPGSGPASGETAQFEVVVQVNPSTPQSTTVTNTAETYSYDTAVIDGTSGNNSKSVSTTVDPGGPSVNADLAIATLTASPTPNVMVGSNITYTIGFVNNGPDTAGSASVKNTVPTNTTFVSSRVVSGTGWSAIATPSVGGTGDVIWRKDTPGPASGETAQFEVLVKVNSATLHYTTISDTASTYSVDAGTVDGTPGNNAKSANTRAIVIVDPLEPNDTPATATVLSMGTTPDLIYSAGDTVDNDWYKFFVPPGEAGKDLKVNLRITSPYPDPKPPDWRSDVDFDVLDGALTDLVLARSASDNETLYLHNVASGWYYINLQYSETVYADSNGWARYAITIETGTSFGVGYVTGRVLNGSGQGVANVWVSVEPSPRDWSISFVAGTTGADGWFTVATPPGTFDVLFTGDGTLSANNPTVNVVDEYYSDKHTLATADHISVAGGQTLDLGNISMDVGAIVTGLVTNMSGTPLSNARVFSYTPTNVSKSSAFTDASGNYTLQRVPVGGAKLYFSRNGYASEYYDDQPSFGSGATLNTVSGETLSGINAQLGAGGGVSGTVKDVSGAGVSINVRLYSMLDGTWARAGVTSTAGTGAYSFGGIKPGSYRVFFNAAGSGNSSEWYNNHHSFAGANPVSITAGMMTPNIDAVLARAGSNDFTGDGKADILWRQTTQGDMWGWPSAAPASEQYVGTVSDLNWQIQSMADHTGDGKADLLWRHVVTGAIYLWPGGVQSAEVYVGTVPVTYAIVGTGDYDGDGKADLLWRHVTNGDLWFWRMDGATRVSEEYVGTVDPAYVIVGSGDLNGDGLYDLVWRHTASGAVWVWIVSDTDMPAEYWVATVGDMGYEVRAVADFTGDGRADILWRHATQGDVWLWAMNGATRLSDTYVATVDPAYDIVAAGDYDGNQKADLLWRHTTQGDVWMWLMNGATRLSETYVATIPIGYQIVR